MRRNILMKLAAVTMAMSVILTGCGSNSKTGSSSQGDSSAKSASELTTLRLGVMTGNVDSWIADVGKEKSIYEKYGLDVQVTEYAAGINTVDAMVTNQIDIGMTADFAGVNRIGSTADQTNLRYISQINHSTGSKLYVNPETITKLSDLKGKKIMAMQGTVWEYWNAKTIEAAGLSSDDVESVPIETSNDSIAVASAGDADAYWASGETGKRLEAVGWKALTTLDELLGLNVYSYYMSTSDYAKDNEETIAKFLQATDEIETYMLDNEDEVADILYNATGMEQDTYKNTIESLGLSIAFDQSAYDDLCNVAEWTYENGYYDNQINIDDYIDVTALNSTFPDLGTYTVK